MKKIKGTICLLCIATALILVIRGVIRTVHDRRAAEIRADFEEKISEFENTVDDDLYDIICAASSDIKDAETTGRVEIFPVHRRDATWYEFNTYIDIRIYVDKNLSRMDHFAIRDYLERFEKPFNNIIRIYLQSDFPLAYYRTDEGLEELGKYLYNVDFVPSPVMSEIYIIDINGDEYRYGYIGYYVNGECIERPFLSNGSSNSSGSGHSSSGSHHGSSGSYSGGHAWDVDDYDDPDDYADDAWGEDFDDWDDAYDYWEDNY
ncbi:MAG: hypothetical protein K6G43_00235 [Lachnospiraceae bacterium]|nr:hypothetical protein [Lachnospiraceae bacterium]